jgi:hypothetical protein
MQSENFAWRDAKAAENLRDHGIAFDTAVKAFADPFAVKWIDEREAYGEERCNLPWDVRGCDPARHLHRAQRADQDYFSPAGGATRTDVTRPRPLDVTEGRPPAIVGQAT